MRAEAYAKVNLSLRVGRREESGYHSIESWMQTISWSDGLTLAGTEEDRFDAAASPPAAENLAWRALLAVREASGRDSPVRLELVKRVPAAAGLGGGSADAATTLKLAALHYGFDPAATEALAPDLGADVPFLMTGGLAAVGGYGERVDRRGDGGGYALVVVVPPVELSTPGVYAAWDALKEPRGTEVAGADLPPSLRPLGPLANDLYPAAVHLHPGLGEWRNELVAVWSRPVLMSGSGPSLFGFFVDGDEADAAVGAIPVGARAAESVTAVPRGCRIDGGTLAVPARWGVV